MCGSSFKAGSVHFLIRNLFFTISVSFFNDLMPISRFENGVCNMNLGWAVCEYVLMTPFYIYVYFFKKKMEPVSQPDLTL